MSINPKVQPTKSSKGFKPRHDSGWWPLRARGLLDDLIEFPHDRAEPPKKNNKGQHPLATRIMSNGVGVIVADGTEDQTVNQKSKLLRGLPSRPMSLTPSTLDNNVRITVTSPEKQTNHNGTRQSPQLLASSTSIATERNTRHPVLQLKHNYVIKTCFTTFTYLTTLMRKSRTIVSTYETVVSTVTTEPLIITPTLTQFDKNTKQIEKPQSQFQATQLIQNALPKIEKRIDDLLQNLATEDDDSQEEEESDIIQPSEVSPSPHSCSVTSCPCTVTLTESLKDNKYQTQIEDTPLQLKRSPLKTKYGSTVIDIAPTSVIDIKGDKHTKKPSKHSSDKINHNNEGSTDDKNKNKEPEKSVNGTRITDDKRKPQNTNDKNKEPPKPPKTKFQVADLLKLGTLGIKKLAPMIEQMTGTLKKRQEEINKQSFKPATTVTPYIVNKRIDSIDTSGSEQKPTSGKFPIYIPVDEDLQTAESQNGFVNSTLHQNLIWASQNLKNSRNNIGLGKPIHESPLVNGGIPISPGEIITANSDVIVGKPAVGGPNIKEIKPTPDYSLMNNNGPSFLDSHPQPSQYQDSKARPPLRGQGLKHIPIIRDDDSYDLKPPMMPVPKQNLPPPHQHLNQHMNQNHPQGHMHIHHHPNIEQSHVHHHNKHNLDHHHHHHQNHNHPIRQEFNSHPKPHPNIHQDQIISENRPIGRPSFIDNDNKPHDVFTDHIEGSIHPPIGSENHGRPAFIDYIPSLAPEDIIKNNLITRKNHEDGSPINNLDKIKPTPSKVWHNDNKHIPIRLDENIHKPIKEAPEPILLTDLVQKSTVKPFLVDIQPSRVANVIIPHGSSTALIFSGNSEPHKNGEYIDDPLPYSEPGYFGSFSIDAPHLTSVHVGGKNPVQNANTHSDHRVPHSGHIIHDNIPERNKPEPSVVNHGISGLNQEGKPPPGHRWKYNEGNHHVNFRIPAGNLPPPISKKEHNMHFGPQRKPEQSHIINMNFGPDVNKPPPVGNLRFGEGPNKVKTTTADYESDLAVPPPPPPTVQIKFESNVGVLNSEFERFKNGGNVNLRPQDSISESNNIQGLQQRPFPIHQNENSPPRITSEVYFASQSPNGDRFSQRIPPFSVDLPDPSKYNNNYRPHVHQQNVASPSETVHFPSDSTKFINTFDGGFVTLNAGTKVNIPNVASGGHVDVRPLGPQHNTGSGISGSHFTIPQQGGLITLNAGASVHGVNFPEQTISGTSISAPVPHQISNQINYHEIKEINLHEAESTGIPIGTNVAIKVEPQHIQPYEQNIQVGIPSLPTSHGIEKGPEIIVGGNSWQAGRPPHDDDDDEINGSINGIPDSIHNGNEKVHVVHASTISEYNITHVTEQNNVIQNSHANFPITKETANTISTTTTVRSTQKPIVTNEILIKDVNSKPAINTRHPSFISNQHAGVSHHDNSYIEVFHRPKPVDIPKPYITTERQVIRTTQKERPKISNEVRFDTTKPTISPPSSISYNWQTIPKPFEKPILKPKPTANTNGPVFMGPPPQTYSPSYIPTTFENRQPAYEIPKREEKRPQKSTSKPIYDITRATSQPPKVFINENTLNKGEISSGSAKIPVLSSTPTLISNEVTINYDIPYRNISRIDNKLHGNNKVVFNADNNSGSQTEEPFDKNKYANPANPPITQNPITRPYGGPLAPRPFTPKDQEDNIIENVRVDMPNPRPFRKQPQESDENMSLNIGEIQIRSSTTPVPTTPSTTKKLVITEQPSRPTRRPLHRNTTSYYITEKPSTATRRPNRTRSTTTKPPTTIIDITTMANNDSMIIPNLSPPPPTIDYSFKPTGNSDETIMGMNPPPKTPSPKPGNEYPKFGDISTYRPSYNTQKNQFRRPADYYRITTRPFTRHTTPSTIRGKPTTGTTTITRLVYTTRSTAWRNPVRGETKSASSVPIILPTAVEMPSVINTQPTTVGPEIIHPDTYPEENSNIASTSILPNLISPDRVVPHIYSTAVRPSEQPSIISAPSVVYRPQVLQGSEKFHDDNIFNKETESIRPQLTIKLEETSRLPINPPVYKYTKAPVQHVPSQIMDDIVNLRPIHHGGNEIKQSDDVINKPDRVTAVTFTTTLSEPASTVLTTKFVTLTHTLTVTQTKTSVVSPVIDSTTQTQTLILTNTQTSTVVDIVTEIHTLVQPTTIVQTITKHVPITTLPSWETKYPKVPIEPTNIRDTPYQTHGVIKLDDVSLTSDEEEFIIRPDEENEVVLNTNATSGQEDNDTFFVVMNKSQNGGSAPSLPPILEEDDFDGATRDEELNNDGVSHVLLGEILLAGTPFMESGGVRPTGSGYGKECQPECQASRNERCQRTHGLMRCVCRPGFARMFPDRPCKPTYTYSMKLALSRYGGDRLVYQKSLGDQTSQDFQTLAEATHEGINRMVMQSDLRDVYHGVHVNGFLPVTIPARDGHYMGVVNDFYVQLSDNAHENRLKEVVEKYLRTNNYSLGGSEVYAAAELVDKLEVGDFNECASVQFHDCSEHAECFNLRASYTCSCREGYADLSPNPLYPGRMCSAEAVGCEKCHYHGTCYNRDESVLCECFQWYAGEHCQINLKVILISLSTLGALLFVVLLVCLILGCARKKRTRPHPMMAGCLAPHQSTMQSSKHHSTMDKRALIQERGNDSGGEGSSVHNAPYIPAKKISQISQKSKRSSTQESCEKGKPFTLMIPRAKYCPGPTSPLESSRENTNSGRRKSSNAENTTEAKLLQYLEGGAQELSRRKQSQESCYSMNQSTVPKKYSTGALVSAGFKVSTTVTEEVRVKEPPMHDDDDVSSVTKSHTLATIDMQSQYNSLRKAYSNEDMNDDWTDAERRIGELTMSEARSFDGTLVKPAQKLMRSTTGSNKSSAHYTQHEANTMAERDLGSTFLLPHVHLYKPDMGSDVSEFDSL